MKRRGTRPFKLSFHETHNVPRVAVAAVSAFFFSLKENLEKVEQKLEPEVRDVVYQETYQQLSNWFNLFYFCHNDPSIDPSLHFRDACPEGLYKIEVAKPFPQDVWRELIITTEHGSLSERYKRSVRDFLLARPTGKLWVGIARLLLRVMRSTKFNLLVWFGVRLTVRLTLTVRKLPKLMRRGLSFLFSSSSSKAPQTQDESVALGVEMEALSQDAIVKPSPSEFSWPMIGPEDVDDEARRLAQVAVINQLSRASVETIELLSELVVARHLSDAAGAFSLLDRLAREGASDANKPVVFVTPAFPTTWAPVAYELVKSGTYVVACCLSEIKKSADTGVLASPEIPASEVAHLRMLGHLILFYMQGRASYLVNSDGFLSVSWMPHKAVILNLLAQSMLEVGRVGRENEMGAEDGTLALFRYDAIQPLTVSQEDPLANQPVVDLAGEFFLELLNTVDKIILNANAGYMGRFFKQDGSLVRPLLHFYRYSLRPLRSVEKLPRNGLEDLQIVVLTNFLSDTDDHTRANQGVYVRSLILQKFHINYFCNPDSPAVAEFRESLPPEFRKYFHTHRIVRDQRELVERIQCFHLGLALSHDGAFKDCIALLGPSFYRDAIDALWKSTMPSGPFVMAAAGLPFVGARFWLGLVEVFGTTSFLQASLEELPGLRERLENDDFEARVAHAEVVRENHYMENKIHDLLEFLESNQ